MKLRGLARAFDEDAFSWRSESIFILLVAGLPILLPYLLHLHEFLFADASFSTLPMKALAIRAMQNGELPLWSSALGAGLPVIGDGISLPYDPRNLWWGILHPLDAYVAILLTSRCLLMLVCYLYFRKRLMFSRGPAFTATCIYFCGTVFVMDVGYSHLSSLIEAVPMMAWLAERLLDRPGLQRAAYLALGWFLVLLISSVAYFVFLPFVVGAWAFMIWFSTEQPERKRRLISFALWYAAAHLWGLALFAFALFPFVEMANLSNRGTEYLSDPFAWRSLWGMIVGPSIQLTSLLSPPFAFFLYVGVVTLPLVFASVAARAHTTPRIKAASRLVVPTVAGILLLTTPIKAMAANILPLVNSIAFFRFSYFWGFLAAVLTGFALQQRNWRPSAATRGVIATLIAVQLAVVAFVIVYWAIATIGYLEFPEEVLKAHIRLLPASVAWAMILFACIRLTGLSFCLRPGGPLRRTLIGGFVAIELLMFFSVYGLEEGNPFPRTSEVDFLTKQASPNYRVMQILQFDNRGKYLSESNDWSILSLHLNAQAWWPGILSANAYNSLMPATYWSFIRAIGDRPAPWRGATGNVVTEKGDSPLLPLLGVRWLISRHKLDPGPYRLVHVGEAYYVYELNATLPRAYGVAHALSARKAIVHQILSDVGSGTIPAESVYRTVLLRPLPSEAAAAAAATVSDLVPMLERNAAAAGTVPANVVSDSGNRAVVEVDMPTAGWLVLTDNHYPGWRATVNGRDSDIRRANLFARAVAVPAGRSRIEFRYQPASFWYGVYASITAAAMTVLALIVLWWMRRRTLRASVVAAKQLHELAVHSAAIAESPARYGRTSRFAMPRASKS
jgi:hypothetical protein